MRLLAMGDIHLGRHPARLPTELADYVRLRELTPAAALRRAIDLALDLAVDAVLFAGDVVEQSDDFYEAYTDLLDSVRRLTAAGIRAVAVAGNHDVTVLPRLAAAVPGFHLLGRGGVWEREVLPGTGGQEVVVTGWSFPGRHVHVSPLASGIPARDHRPAVGLLHCDRDQTGSRYAPVRSAELEAAPVDAWLLGHSHKPDVLTGPRPIGYLGSVCAYGPRESGPRGPWLLDIPAGGNIQIEQVSTSPLRWEEVEVSTDGQTCAEDIHTRVTTAVDELHHRLAGEKHRPLAVGYRILVTGRTRLRTAINRVLTASDPRQFPHRRGETVYFCHEWRLDALPDIDLDAIARGRDPLALLARRLLLVRSPVNTPERTDLIERVRAHLTAHARSSVYAALDHKPPDTEQTAALIEAAAIRILDEMLAEGGGA